MKIEIRKFDKKDVINYMEEITKMETDNFYTYHFPNKLGKHDQFIEKSTRLLENFIEQDQTYFYGVIDSNQKLQGYIWFYEMITYEKRIILRSIRVNSEIRRNKIGSNLMNIMKKVAKERQVDVIALHYAIINKGAKKFYQSLGFQEARVEMIFNNINEKSE